jgi:hypothetical protein
MIPAFQFGEEGMRKLICDFANLRLIQGSVLKFRT